MENKKQLIIIPPMSDAVKKLHEVLEGVADDENMEITLIDDLKELSQFIGTTGQCLILVSNAKKCATFLQENRFFLLKNHCKTILFTPKEIPAKTLVKFTKIGLTESILESSPPKTFLYKVKLLLRSIKTAKVVDDAEKIVKSLDNITAAVESDLEVKEKVVAEENVIDMERAKKEQIEGETIDYGNPLKGKVKPIEENLDTHWKSDRKKAEITFAEDDNGKPHEAVPESIDMYMRGINRKTINIETEEADFDKKMAELLAAEEEAKRKSNFADVIDEGTMKQKRIKLEDGYNPEEDEDKAQLAELDLEAASIRPKKKNIEPEEDDFDKKMAELLAAEAEAKRKNEAQQVEDLGGYLKGKISQLPTEEEEKDQDEPDPTYDNSELEDEKRKSVELELLDADRKKTKKDTEGAEADGKAHEGEVDHIDGNMIGDEGTVDKIRTRMEGRSSKNEDDQEEDNSEDIYAKKKKLQDEDEDNEDREKDSLDIAPEEREAKKRETLRSEAEDKDFREKTEKTVELDLDPADKKASQKDDESEDKERERKSLETVEAAERERKSLEKNSEAERKGREFKPQNEDAKSNRNQTHDSTVDKIDTYYRGGDASKKKDQDWSNLIDKKDTLELLPGKEKRTDGTAAAAGKADLGEQTIDYRKLKEEFDAISSGASASEVAGDRIGTNGISKNEDDNDSFRVIEIDPKSLDFSINIINSIYQKDLKAKQIFALLADELVNNYQCYPIFYTYKLSEKKFIEAFNPFVEIRDDRISEAKKEFWNEFKKDNALFEKFHEKSMTTWRCSEIINNGEVWEDVELPSWAENELKSKKVELIFPYFDGIDRMGLAVVLFPDGLDPKSANGLLTVLELARALFLDTIQRYQVQPVREEKKEESTEETPAAEEKKNVLSFFGGLFGKKKAG